MSCDLEHRTIAWAYGEADEAHLHHVASCAHCAQIVEVYSDLLPFVSAPSAPTRQRHTWALLIAGCLLAASALLLVLPSKTPPSFSAPSPFYPLVDVEFDDLQREFIALDDALDALEADLQTF